MFQSLRDRFSTDDAAKAEKKARKAETVAKRRELQLQRRAADRKRGRHYRGTGGGS
jgi:hypothetical protein